MRGESTARLESGQVVYRYDGKRYSRIFYPGSNHFEGLRVDMEQTEEDGDGLVKVLFVPYSELTVEDFYVEFSLPLSEGSRVMVNGYQSWTHSREYRLEERLNPMNTLFQLWVKHYFLKMYGEEYFYSFKQRKGSMHSYTYTYIREPSETYLFFASLNERSGYTIFEINPRSRRVFARKDCRGLKLYSSHTALEMLISRGEQDEVWDGYFRRLGVPVPATPPTTGWTSWYNYYEKISEEIILNNVRSFSNLRLPIDIFQIDDGYQAAVGDWLLTNQKFPSGMKALAEKIHKAGYRAGLWLAPFICEEKSLLRKEHSDWILHDAAGHPVVAGNNPFNWSGKFYALNIYHEGLRDYLRVVFETVLNKWGFDMVKLDFLYAAAMSPAPDKTRGGVMCDAMDLVREYCGNKLILGCGVPLGPSFGKVDYCRIGSDVALSWEDKRLSLLGYRERVSAFNSLTSTIGRNQLNFRAFLNDPDVFILRDENCWLSPEQKKTLYYLNQLFGGLVFTSDNPDEYTPEQLYWYRAQFPFLSKKINLVYEKDGLIAVAFTIGDLEYRLFANLTDKDVPYHLEDRVYFESMSGFVEGASLKTLPAYATRCYLKIGEEDTVLAGSTGRLFPASEVSEFKPGKKNITVKWDKRIAGKGQHPPFSLYIRIPAGLEGFKVNGNFMEANELYGLNLVTINL